MSTDEKIKTAAKKPPVALVPQQALTGAARVFAYGALKYSAGNFLNATLDDGAGARYIGAALRHMTAMQLPNGLHTPESLAALDEESGLPHIDHVLCGLIMLRSIMVKSGALPIDPGEGLEPPAARAAANLQHMAQSVTGIQETLAEVRVQNGQYDVVPFEGEFGGARTVIAEADTSHPVADAVFKGREVDDYANRDVEPRDPYEPFLGAV